MATAASTSSTSSSSLSSDLLATEITQHWNFGSIFLSYLISATGSYCTIQLMEQWRIHDNKQAKSCFLVLASIALGGCSIWGMHFTGMHALELRRVTPDPVQDPVIQIDFEGGLTMLSCLLAIFGVLIGLKLASKDPFFEEIEKNRRKTMLAKNLVGMSMQGLVRRNTMGRRIRYTALFSRLGSTVQGGFFTALSVLAMHYLGMLAQLGYATMTLSLPVVGVSCGIAFLTANAAFWILFRVLTFWPGYESLRLVSAALLGLAVCGTHYVGMLAASYEYTEISSTNTTTLLFDGGTASSVASHGALLCCFWLTSFAVTKELRSTVLSLLGSDNLPRRMSSQPYKVISTSHTDTQQQRSLLTKVRSKPKLKSNRFMDLDRVAVNQEETAQIPVPSMENPA